ncbi:RDD family protein [Nanoarchaeota archaeon]
MKDIRTAAVWKRIGAALIDFIFIGMLLAFISTLSFYISGTQAPFALDYNVSQCKLCNGTIDTIPVCIGGCDVETNISIFINATDHMMVCDVDNMSLCQGNVSDVDLCQGEIGFNYTIIQDEFTFPEDQICNISIIPVPNFILLNILFAILLVLYHFITEAIWGKSIGKYLLHLKVIRIDGKKIGVKESAIRNVIRIADFIGFNVIVIYIPYLIGFFVIMMTKHAQRLGDLAAKTIVIDEKTFGIPSEFNNPDQMIKKNHIDVEAKKVHEKHKKHEKSDKK